ncbi:MAG TPA: UDP-N-acetylmuramoyl-tripeptide--D-alanyl-D-alanine ligase, partial [Acidimicrobiales bacterium]
MRFWAHEIATVTHGTLVGDDVIVDGAGIDSRDLPSGALFVPVVDVRDGHDYIVDALERGASAFLTAHPAPADLPVGVAAVEVPDPAAALSALGGVARDRLAELAGPAGRGAEVVGITGSVGKTTTKDLLAAALGTTYRTSASVRSFNNELGVPLTLLNAPDDTEVAVVEMGARGHGHIEALCAVARPTIGVVTTVEMVHTELFGTMADVGLAKGELVAALPPDGTAVLNADSPLVAAMAERTTARVLRFGLGDHPGGLDLWASAVSVDADLRPRFRLHSPWGEVDVRLGVRGGHNIANALAAAGAALVVGVGLEAVALGLGEAELSPWRMDLQTTAGGARVLNDAYNAGPASMAAALRALASLGVERPVAVLGPMAELGDDGPGAHLTIAALAEDLEVRVVAVAAPDYGPTVEHVADLDGARGALAAGG